MTFDFIRRKPKLITGICIDCGITIVVVLEAAALRNPKEGKPKVTPRTSWLICEKCQQKRRNDYYVLTTKCMDCGWTIGVDSNVSDMTEEEFKAIEPLIKKTNDYTSVCPKCMGIRNGMHVHTTKELGLR